MDFSWLGSSLIFSPNESIHNIQFLHMRDKKFDLLDFEELIQTNLVTASIYDTC
jgi:hypothetical protein